MSVRCAPFLRQHLFDRHPNPDVFIHTWDRLEHETRCNLLNTWCRDIGIDVAVIDYNRPRNFDLARPA